MLSEKMIIKYQKLFKKRFNREISREQTMEEGMRLVRLMQLIYQPIKINSQELQKSRDYYEKN